jgi:hypothetical protein
MAEIFKPPGQIPEIYTLPTAVGIAAVAQQANSHWRGGVYYVYFSFSFQLQIFFKVSGFRCQQNKFRD